MKTVESVFRNIFSFKILYFLFSIFTAYTKGAEMSPRIAGGTLFDEENFAEFRYYVSI